MMKQRIVMRSCRNFLCALALSVLLGMMCASAHAATALVSQNKDGSASSDSGSGNFVFSPDGRKIAFESSSSDLTNLSDTNGVGDVFVRDLASGVTTLVSQNKDGTNSGNSSSSNPIFSPDGSKIAFLSFATDLTSVTDTNFDADIFVHGFAQGVTTVVSQNFAGNGTGVSGTSTTVPSDSSILFSPNGSKIAFISYASNLTSFSDTNGNLDIFVRDLTQGITTLVSQNLDGTGPGNKASSFPIFSPDGSRIAFLSDATNLTSQSDTNNAQDIFVRTLASGVTTLISQNSLGTASGDKVSSYPMFNGDGSKIAFLSSASNLTALSDTNNAPDVFLADTPNTAPIVAANTGLSLVAGTTAIITNSQLNISDADGDTVTYTLATQPAQGSLRLNGGIVSTGGRFTQADINAGRLSYEARLIIVPDSFNFSADDGIGGSVAGTVAIEILEIPSLIVTTPFDATANDGKTSLREAITFANANPDASSITFANGVGRGIGLNSALPDLSSNLSISSTSASTGTGNLLQISGNNNFRVLTISNGTVNGPIVSISGVVILQGSGFNGAGIVNNFGTLNLSNSHLGNNIAANNGGAIYNNGGTVNLSSSTLAGNSAAKRGGAIFNNAGTVNVSNSTFSGNNAALNGGGISNFGTLTVQSSTFSANRATGRGGGIFSDANGTLNLSNSIVAGNTADSGGSDISGTVAAGDYNLVQAISGVRLSGTHNITGQAANLGPLDINGGPTLTFALLPGSPAIDAGNSTLSTDQRGSTRPLDLPGVGNAAGGNAADIGAFEKNESPQISPRFVVNTLADHDDGVCGPTDCSLREAINTANNAAGDDMISFAANVTGTIQLSGALPPLRSNINLRGPGANLLTVRRDTGGNYRLLFIDRSTVSISGLTFTNGFVAGAFDGTSLNIAGGAIYNNSSTTSLTDCVITQNTARFGGGVFNDTSSSLNGISNLSLTNCVISQNSAVSENRVNYGGGIASFNSTANLTNCLISQNSANYGGGIYNGSGNDGSGFNRNADMTLTGCTLKQNTANNQGGGIFNEVYFLGHTTLAATNCTFSQNSANFGSGGGLSNKAFDNCGITATLSHCTFAENSASNGASFYNEGFYAKVLLSHTILAVSSPNVNIENNGGTVTSQGYNLRSDFTFAGSRGFYVNGPGDISNTNPQLGPLADNGGPTPTHALLPGSPALDAGNSTIATDQRGFRRPVDLPAVANATGGNGSDIGAFELDTAQSGSNFVVTSTADTDDGACSVQDCTLREAINASNDTGSALANPVQITFDATVFANTQTISLGTALDALSADVTITGPVARVTLQAVNANTFDIFSVNSGVKVNFNGLNVSRSHYGVNNLGTLVITNCALNNNFYGIYNGTSGTLNAANCTLNANAFGILNLGATATATNCILSGGTNSIVNGSGTLTAKNCTLSGNDNAGIVNATNSTMNVSNCTLSFNYFGILNSGTLTSTNCTLNRNSQYGIYNGSGTLTATNCTVSGNRFGISKIKGAVTLKNTLVVGNDVNTSGSLTNGGHNITSGTAAEAGLELDNTSLPLLKDNGGPTKTIAVLPGSPAINAGNNALLPTDTLDLDGDTNTTEPIPFDQRGTGFARVRGGRIDIGAFEVPGQTPTAIALSKSSVAENSGANAPIGTLSGSDPDVGDTLTFSLPTGRGSNSLFRIVGNALQAKGNFNYEQKNSYAILVRGSDSDGLSFDKKFTISVTDTNDAPVLDNSGAVQLTVSAAGSSITDLLQSGAYNAPISDEDAGAVQGIAVFDALEADSPQGRWEFTTDGGATWTALGAVRGDRARLLASDGSSTRLRFLAKSAAPATLPDALRFFAWDQSHASNGDVNGAFGDASPGRRGGKSAFSLAGESLSVTAPGQAAPQLNITSPSAGTISIAPTQAGGTAASAGGIVSVRCLALYRTKEGANSPGYWNGDLGNPQFLEDNMVSSLPAVQSSDGFATWTLLLPQNADQPALPLLLPGQYRLRMEALDAYGQTTMQAVSFIINDGTPQVTIVPLSEL